MKPTIYRSNPEIHVSGTTHDSDSSEQIPARPVQKKFVPHALCRCGCSCHKPFCDGRHAHAEWLPTLRAGDFPAGRITCL